MNSIKNNGKFVEIVKRLKKKISPSVERLAFLISFVSVTGLIIGCYMQYRQPEHLKGLLNYIGETSEASPREALALPAPHKDDGLNLSSPLEHLPPVPSLTFNEKIQNLDRIDALKDPLNRISADFKVPKGLEKRTEFWFNIYTKYGKHHHVIHHSRYPWIVYKVLDTSPFMDGKGKLWQQRQRGERYVANEKRKILKALKRLSRRKSYRGLKGLEKELYQKLRGLKGKRRTVLRYASQTLRSQLGQKDFFTKGLRVSARYLPYIEEEFSRQGLPLELTRLPFVESSFNEQAQSKVGASGIWQIMPRTGRAHMIVSRNIDERNSPLKATRVAATILKNYKRSLKSWPLAVTSYNHGIGNIRKAIRRAGSRDLPTIIERYHRGDFKFASSNFYTCFLAALHAERYQDVIFKHVTKEPLLEREVLKLGNNFRLKTILKHTGLDRATFLRYNLDLEDSRHKNPLLPKGFELHLPPGHKDKFFKKIGRNEKVDKRQASDDSRTKNPGKRNI